MLLRFLRKNLIMEKTEIFRSNAEFFSRSGKFPLPGSQSAYCIFCGNYRISQQKKNFPGPFSLHLSFWAAQTGSGQFGRKGV